MASGSMCTELGSPAPVMTTRTSPPAAVPVTVRWAAPCRPAVVDRQLQGHGPVEVSGEGRLHLGAVLLALAHLLWAGEGKRGPAGIGGDEPARKVDGPGHALEAGHHVVGPGDGESVARR